MDEGAVIGPFVYSQGWPFIGGDTDNRQLLVDFCISNDLLVANTWYQQPPGKQVTYKEPGTKSLPSTNTNWNPQELAQLDFCLAPSAGETLASRFSANRARIWTLTISRWLRAYG